MLIIAEKPTLAKAIATALGSNKRYPTHYECGKYTVTFCIGHLLELKAPAEYDPAYKNWSEMPVPFVPEKWERVVIAEKRKQFSAVEQLIKKAKIVINAGDPDREGSMLVDTLIQFLGWKGDVWRLLVNDTNINAVKRSLEKMTKFNSTASLSASADARAKADWLFGINLTAAYTLAGYKQGLDRIINIGRVQTPVLGLIVNRHNERKNFKPHDFFNVIATLKKDIEFTVKANLADQGKNEDFDNENRLINQELAKQLAEKAQTNATVIEAQTEQSKRSAPSPYSLSDLQRHANRAFGLTLKETSKAAQELYQAGHTTYPRSDCTYITNELWQEAEATLAALKKINDYAAKADSSLKHSCVNDKKVGAHHAIIPTSNIAVLDKLSKNNKAVYSLIISRYIALFYPQAIDEKTKLAININGLEFTGSGTVEVERGWRDVLQVKAPDGVLPKVSVGEQLDVIKTEVEKSVTKPPEEFTEDTLLGAMTNIAKYITQESLKEIIKDTDGLGTEATRDSIVDRLVERRYLHRQKRNILPTEIGLELISQLPSEIVLPDMTAKWEIELAKIADDKGDVTAFLESIEVNVGKLAKDPQIKISESQKAEVHSCPACEARLARRKGKFGWFWSCTAYSENGCKYTADDNKGKPIAKTDKPKPKKTDTLCPECGNPMLERRGKYGNFLGCSNYPKCKKVINQPA